MLRQRKTPIILALCLVLLLAQYFFGERPQRDQRVAGHVLELTASRDAWLASIADEVNDKRLILKAGNSIRFDFSHSLVLHVGDPGAFKIVYDGSPYTVENIQQTVVLRFPPAAGQP